MHKWVKLEMGYFEANFCWKFPKVFCCCICLYLRAGDRFIKDVNTGQQQKLHKPTYYAETEL